jgi:hypothetical protein
MKPGMPVFTASFSECPILAAFVRVGIFERLTLTFPIIAKSKPPPFEGRKGWGTRQLTYVKRKNDFDRKYISEYPLMFSGRA